jgi:hypothetical protein
VYGGSSNVFKHKREGEGTGEDTTIPLFILLSFSNPHIKIQ